LRASGQVGRTVSVKLRRADFTTFHRSRTLPESTDVAREISAVARGLYDAAGLERTRLRLVGVRVEGSEPAAHGHCRVAVGAEGIVPAEHAHRQLTLGEEDTGWRDVEQVMDRVTARFGPGAVQSAVLAKRDENSL